MGLADLETIPETGAIFTIGRSRFADNVASHFFIRKDPVISIACGDEHSAVICQSGRLFVFGSNDWGQLGLGHKNHIGKPSCLKALKPEKVTHVACGRAHTLICTGGQKIFACGCDQEGQLGRGTSAIGDSASTPVLVYDSGLAGSEVVQIAAGSHHSLALTSDGGVLAWGNNLEGQLGLPDVSGLVNKPTKVHIPEPVKQISAGYYHSTFLTESGLVYVCGESESGKLGIDVNFSTQVTPKQMQIPSPATFVACGGHHTIVLAENGNLYCSGSNSSGQLGLGTNFTELHTPKLLPRGAIQNEKITQISCGESHTAIVTELGKLFTCGDGRHGKLGLEENENNVHELTFVSRYRELFVSNVACGGCHTILVGQRRETNNHMDNSQSDHMQRKNSLPPLKIPLNRLQSGSRDEKVNEIIKDQLNLGNAARETIANAPTTTKTSADVMEQNIKNNKDNITSNITDSMNNIEKSDSSEKSSKPMKDTQKEMAPDASEMSSGLKPEVNSKEMSSSEVKSEVDSKEISSSEVKPEEDTKEMSSSEAKPEISKSTEEAQDMETQSEKQELIKNDNEKPEEKVDAENNVQEKKPELTNNEHSDKDNNNETTAEVEEIKNNVETDEKVSNKNNSAESKDVTDNKQTDKDDVKSEPLKEQTESNNNNMDNSNEKMNRENQMSPTNSTPPPKPPRLKPESGNSSTDRSSWMEKENESGNVENEAKTGNLSGEKPETMNKTETNNETWKKEEEEGSRSMKSAKSGSSKSSRSKVGTEDTIEIDKQNDKEKIIEEEKTKNDNVQDDADVVQSPPPRTGKVSKIFKSSREKKSQAIENGTKTAGTMNHKSKSKTCTIL